MNVTFMTNVDKDELEKKINTVSEANAATDRKIAKVAETIPSDEHIKELIDEAIAGIEVTPVATYSGEVEVV